MTKRLTHETRLIAREVEAAEPGVVGRRLEKIVRDQIKSARRRFEPKLIIVGFVVMPDVDGVVYPLNL